jgi:hypothetical protein
MHDGKVIWSGKSSPVTDEQSGHVLEADDGLWPGSRTPSGLLATFCDATHVKALGIIDSFHAAAIHLRPAGFTLAGVSTKLGPGEDRLNDGIDER